MLRDECYDTRYDLDSDGDIDVVDIMKVAARWGTTALRSWAQVK